ncbi:hypothetical protein BsIDN1_67950 [Bacillus safensis]|uniref:Glutamate/phenylalanine/leucine/valine/L-tryptophan dehydrogenase C-terminal domain-containing protein n=1 Tax=Bacillus safensis TaxID=561879 RepID=A0A5S9MIA6_BACIA|nr:hypothetical protein BsIDN1_67950 [Bacillus safensis]
MQHKNEISEAHAQQLVANGVIAVGEGANMPSTLKAVKVFEENRILFAPAKAANAGGVGVSALKWHKTVQEYLGHLKK